MVFTLNNTVQHCGNICGDIGITLANFLMSWNHVILSTIRYYEVSILPIYFTTIPEIFPNILSVCTLTSGHVMNHTIVCTRWYIMVNRINNCL